MFRLESSTSLGGAPGCLSEGYSPQKVVPMYHVAFPQALWLLLLSGWAWLLCAVSEPGFGLCSGSARDSRSWRWALEVLWDKLLILRGPRPATSHGHGPRQGQPWAGPHFLSSLPVYPQHCCPSPNIPVPTGSWTLELWCINHNKLETFPQPSNHISYIWKNIGSTGTVLWAFQIHRTLHFMLYHAFTHSFICVGVPPICNL